MTGKVHPIRKVLDGAYEASGAGVAGGDFPAHEPLDGDPWGPGDELPPDGAVSMPAGCPVEPLGTHNNIFYFLTALGELRPLAADKVANKHIVGMFAPFTQYLFDEWPRKKEVEITDDAGKVVGSEWIVTGWRADDVSLELMKVCGARGVWSPRDKVRGRGAHRDEKGGLILHCGSHVLIGGEWRKPAQYDGFVYPTAPKIPRPGPDPAARFAIDAGGEGEQEVPVGLALLHWLKQWSWARPTIDPILMLGCIAIARFGGAIDWRPVVWLSGEAAAGKSSLMDLIGDLFDGGLLKLESATEAAVRQLLGQDTLPVVLDEAEGEADSRAMDAIIKLARIAASGGNTGKGGADHAGVQFTAKSCFLFSSILIPGLLPQDKSRMAVLELTRLAAGLRTGPRILRADHAAERRALGTALTRRIVDHWGRWERTFDLFSDALIDVGGHKGRGAKVFATLLAAAHIALDDDDPSAEELVMWGGDLAVSRLAEMRDADGDDKRVMQHLATSLVQLTGHAAPRMVSEWIGQAAKVVPDRASGDLARDVDEERRKAKEALARIGIGLMDGSAARRKAGEDDEGRPRPLPGRTYLVVANAHQGLGKLFAESDWKGRAGAVGGWAQSLKRIPGAIANERQRIAGQLLACTLVPIEAVWGDETAPESAEAGVETVVEAVDA
ncbi:MAG: hypothetical protein QOH04_2594 [Sphingomonadales bacterium]|jgi:hypothetical protein|nr:hypothetical protein [Sphingomonadales bacterium]